MNIRVKVRKVLKIWVPITILASGLFAAYLWLEGVTAMEFFGQKIYNNVPPQSYFVTLEQGKTITIPVRIFKRRLYLLELELEFKTEAERSEVKNLIGLVNDKARPGISLTFDIMVQTQNGTIILERTKTTSRSTSESHSPFRRAVLSTIDEFILDPGNYNIMATPIDANNNLSLFNEFKQQITFYTNFKTTIDK